MYNIMSQRANTNRKCLQHSRVSGWGGSVVPPGPPPPPPPAHVPSRSQPGTSKLQPQPVQPTLSKLFCSFFFHYLTWHGCFSLFSLGSCCQCCIGFYCTAECIQVYKYIYTSLGRDSFLPRSPQCSAPWCHALYSSLAAYF